MEEARAGVQITSVVAISGLEDRQDFVTDAEVTALWAQRALTAIGHPTALLSEIETLKVRPDTFVWIAAEAGVARAIRDHFTEKRGHPPSWMKAAGYWVAGRADANERLE